MNVQTRVLNESCCAHEDVRASTTLTTSRPFSAGTRAHPDHPANSSLSRCSSLSPASVRRDEEWELGRVPLPGKSAADVAALPARMPTACGCWRSPRKYLPPHASAAAST